MKNILAAAVLFLALSALTACTDAERSRLLSYGDTAKITCYSGGKAIFEDYSTGKVLQSPSGGLIYESKLTGKHTRAYADCIMVVE